MDSVYAKINVGGQCCARTASTADAFALPAVTCDTTLRMLFLCKQVRFTIDGENKLTECRCCCLPPSVQIALPLLAVIDGLSRGSLSRCIVISTTSLAGVSAMLLFA